MENNPATHLIVFESKAINRMHPSLYGRQVVEPSNLSVVVAQFLTMDLADGVRAHS